MSAALKRAHRKNFSDLSFVEPLSRLMRSYHDEADLSAFGRYAVKFDVARCLNNLLRFDKVEEAAPELRERAITEPVFITGLPRSGTTFLHTLLAQDNSIAAPRAWQMIYPYPSRARVDLRKAWVSLQLGIMRFLSPEVSDLHPLTADVPQECTDITAQVFQSLRFDSTYRVPSYQSWLDQRGHVGAYRFHRRFLQHLDVQAPGRRWVLKSPDHVFALDAIRTVYPDAKIVYLHRDPISVLASVAKLTEVLRRPFTTKIDSMEIGRQVRASWIDGAQRMIDDANSPNVLHLHYADLVAQPMQTVSTLYRHCGIDLSLQGKARMEAWLARKSKSGNSQSRYRLADFGLEEESLRRDFARYMNEFRVQAELRPSRAALGIT